MCVSEEVMGLRSRYVHYVHAHGRSWGYVHHATFMPMDGLRSCPWIMYIHDVALCCNTVRNMALGL